MAKPKKGTVPPALRAHLFKAKGAAKKGSKSSSKGKGKG